MGQAGARGGGEGVFGVGVGGVLELCAGAVNLVGWNRSGLLRH